MTDTEREAPPARMNAAIMEQHRHEEAMARATHSTTPETKIELDYKKVAGADPLTTWHLEVVPGFDADEWQRMLDTATAAHEALLAKFNSASPAPPDGEVF